MRTDSLDKADIELEDGPAQPDDLARKVYGVLGIPIDAVSVETVLRKIKVAAGGTAPFLISTANLNFVVASRSDAEFRESLLFSDLCTADGMPVFWIAKLLGFPITSRAAGSDMFEALKSACESSRPLKTFLFGGAEGIAAAACKALNAEGSGLTCTGSFYPGFGSIDEMSSDAIIDAVNSSKADFLVVALGAKKGQLWLHRNHERLKIPVRAHLGTVINFQARSLRRAPAVMQKWGLEWLWRIKEEPHLWRRYWADGKGLAHLMLTSVVPLIVLAQWHVSKERRRDREFKITRADDLKSVILRINGNATASNVDEGINSFRKAIAANQDVVINCAAMSFLDARFIGLLLMLDKQLKQRYLHLRFTEVPPHIQRIFRLSGFEFLLRT